MKSNESYRSRRLLALFLLTTLLPAVCLSWLAWKVVSDERQQRRDPIRDRREQAADAATSALQRLLAHAEERLPTIGVERVRNLDSLGAVASVARVDGLTYVALSRFGTSFAGAPLLYYPAMNTASGRERPFSFESTLLPARQLIDEKEFLSADFAGALTDIEALMPRDRANSLVRIARIQRKLGSIDKALAAYSTLATFGGARAAHLPATLVAAKGRALIYAEIGRLEDLHREAADIHHGLVSRRWTLTRGAFQHAYEQTLGWLAVQPPPLDTDQVAVAEAAEWVWQEWRSNAPSRRMEITRRTIRIDGVPVFIERESTPDSVTAMLITPRFLERGWRSTLHTMKEAQGVEFALYDADDQPVLGGRTGPSSRQSVRQAAGTQLPWTIYATSTDTRATPWVSTQSTIVLAGIAVMGLFAIVGGFMINRATLRELRAAQMQSDFVAAVSHEFRTPLTTLRQLAELLAQGRVSNDERRGLFYSTLLRETQRLQRLVEGLLNFGSMEAGELEYRFEQLAVAPFVRDVIADFEQSIEGRGYRIELCNATSPHAVRGDRELLTRVLWNLLDNAVKYSPDHKTIRVDLADAGQCVTIRISDQGVGIPPAEQATIFDKFVRGAASRAANVPGTGVGLALARQIVLAHRGELRVDSQPGRGSTFSLLLPIAGHD